MLPERFFPQFPEHINHPGPETPPEKRKCGAEDVSLTLQGSFFA
jgi:hypothetical protein